MRENETSSGKRLGSTDQCTFTVGASVVCFLILCKTKRMREDLSAFMPIWVDPHLFDWMVVIPCSNERTTG